MDHSYYKERISAYADNALPPYEQMAVQEHVESCPECRAALEKILKLTAWIDSEANLSGEEYFELQAQKIEQRLGIAQTEITPVGKRSWQGLGWKLTTVAASITLVGIVVFLSKDTVLQKSEPPVINAPSIPKQESTTVIQAPEDIGSNMAASKKVIRATESKDVAVPDTTTGSPKEESARTAKMTPPVEDENYKTSPQEMAPLTAPVDTVRSEVDQMSLPIQETKPSNREDVKLESAAGKAVETTAQVVKGKRERILQHLSSGEKFNRPESIKAQPTQRIDDLLKSVAGVKSDSTGEVSIRGGRAGEVEYIVDGVPTTDPVHRTPIKEEPGILAYWYTVCDSLERAKQAGVAGKAASLANRLTAKPSNPTTLREEPVELKATLAEAYYRIARISRDSTEIARVTDSLKSIAADTKSPERAQAKAYLDSLGAK